ncbi:MAG: oxygenase MpaB family protein [Flavisolibacter sp.]
MEYFVSKESIVRTIWGKGDTILFIFAGSAAEFALNKAVDWLYFTGKLPADPLGRLFETVSYAREIVFSEKQKALDAIDRIRHIHTAVENARGSTIPAWAYRDVLYMLIHYSIAAYELLERKLTDDEKEEVFRVFRRLGERMELKELPVSFPDWLKSRREHLLQDLAHSDYTADLFQQYKKHLGVVRYQLLKEGQVLVVPDSVRRMLGFKKFSLLSPVVPVYKLSRKVHADTLIKALILPPDYKQQIKDLDVVS